MFRNGFSTFKTRWKKFEFEHNGIFVFSKSLFGKYKLSSMIDYNQITSVKFSDFYHEQAFVTLTSITIVTTSKPRKSYLGPYRLDEEFISELRSFFKNKGIKVES